MFFLLGDEYKGKLRIRTRLEELLSEQSQLHQQFDQIGSPERPAVVGFKEVNMAHNRYTDIGKFSITPRLTLIPVPFDDNLICLDSNVFVGAETVYVNASRVVFPGSPRRFIASQAPTRAAVKHFWHMVIQEEVTHLFNHPSLQVSLIVMITRLREGGVQKADEYWPNQYRNGLDIGGGLRVILIREPVKLAENPLITMRYHREKILVSLLCRTFLVWTLSGGTRVVSHLATEGWPTRGVPDNPRWHQDRSTWNPMDACPQGAG